jgi:CRP/FNR family transcriptional regulator
MPGNNTIESCSNCINEWINFRTLTESELDFVNQNRYEAAYKRGEILIKQGSPASNALFLASGMAKTYMEGVSGNNFLIGIDKPGRLIMGPGAYVNSRNNFTVSAITEVKACFISFEVIRHLVRVNGAFAEGMIEFICSKSLKSHIRMINLTHKKMPGRLAESLIYLADEVFMSDEFEMILSRKELGDMTNMARESVVRILGEFDETGVLKSDSHGIKILNKEKLILISERG